MIMILNTSIADTNFAIWYNLDCIYKVEIASYFYKFNDLNNYKKL